MTDLVGTLRAQAKIFDEMAEIHLRHHYEDMRQQGMKQAILANCFTSAADEIERQRGALRHLLIQLDGVPVKHPQQGEQRAAAREMLNIQQPSETT